jgi:hypothetical protein
MFNLEQAIVEWRQQMLAAGIKTPVPLEELESHLREEIEELMKSGLSDQQAFEATLLQIGQGQELQTEFAKERSWADLLRGNHIPIMPKLMLFMWALMCGCEYNESATHRLPHTYLIISSIGIVIAAYMVGIFWSLFLLNTQKRVCRIIQIISATANLLFVALMVLSFFRRSFFPHHISSLWMIPFYFNLFTGVLLNSRFVAEQKNASK